MSAPRARHPVTRSLTKVLRQQARDARTLRLLVAGVVSVPDSAHVVVDVNGDGLANVSVPRLASYTAPAAGDVVYLLCAGSLVIALGTCK
jgi:hypothetical protein